MPRNTTQQHPAGAARPRRVVVGRRLFALSAIAVLATLGLSMGTSFAAGIDSATTPQLDSHPLLLVPRATVPDAVKALRYSSTTGTQGLRRVALRRPRIANDGRIAQVVRSGDLVLVSTVGRTTPLQLSVYVTNLPELRKSYSSFAIELGLWQTAHPAAHSSWKRSTSPTFVTDSTGKVTFELAPGRFYDITLEQGGSLESLPGRTAVGPTFFIAR